MKWKTLSASCIHMHVKTKQVNKECTWSSCVWPNYTSQVIQINAKVFAFFTDANKTQQHKLQKFRSVIGLLLDTFQRVCICRDRICINESLAKFRGRPLCMQFNPSLRGQFCIKIYKSPYWRFLLLELNVGYLVLSV